MRLAVKIKINDIEALVIDSDKYVQINDISDTDLRKIWGQLCADYVNYEKWFCFRNVDTPPVLTEELGAVLVDDCIQMRLYADRLNYSNAHKIEPIEEEDFTQFAAFHDKRNPGIHWAGAQLLRDLPKWGVFCIHHNGCITDYVLISMWDAAVSEIYCVETADYVKCKNLMSFAAKYAFENGKNEVLYNADDDLKRDAALSVGFVVTGFYKGYRTKPVK